MHLFCHVDVNLPPCLLYVLPAYLCTYVCMHILSYHDNGSLIYIYWGKNPLSLVAYPVKVKLSMS